VGGVEQDQAGPGTDGRGQLTGVERPPGGLERDHLPPGSGHGDGGPVRVVERLEHHDLVPCLAQGQDGGGDGFVRPRRDQDLGIGVDLEPVEPLLMGGDGPSQLGRTRPGRILVAAIPDSGDGRLGDFGRAVAIGEPLAQVDRPGPLGQGRHLGENGGAEALQAGDELVTLGAGVTHYFSHLQGRARPLAACSEGYPVLWR